MGAMFREIPSSWRVPGVYSEFDLYAGKVGLASASDMILILAPMISSGTASSGQVDEIMSTGASKTLYGAKSVVHCMIRASLVANNQARIFAVGLPDSGVKAVKTITITASSAKTGTLAMYFGFRMIQITGAEGDTPTILATALVAAINKDEFIPFTATNAAGVITLTAVNGGVMCQNMKISPVSAPTGVTVATSNTTTGSGEPDLTSVLSKIEQEQFSLIVHPWTSSTILGAVKTHIDLVGDALHQRGRGQVAVAGDGDVAAAPSDITAVKTLAAGLNHWRTTLGYLRGSKSPNYEIAAAYAAVLAKQPRPGDTVNDYALTGIDVPAVADRLLESEKNSLLNPSSGVVTPLGVAGESVVIVKAVVTYYQNPDGAQIQKLCDWITYRALDYVRLCINNMEKIRYKNRKNNADTRDSLKADIYAVLKLLEKPDMEIVQNVDANKGMISVESDSVIPGRANADIPSDIVPGLDIIANRIRLL